jgi:ABC-type hemin transport system substrate-binding protein
MFDLGFGDAVVGITDYCIHPVEKLAGLVRVGGVKTPRVHDIINLKPDLVLANQEENTPEAIYALQDAGITVWLTFPKTIREAVDALWVMAGIFQSKIASASIRNFRTQPGWATAAGVSVFTIFVISAQYGRILV